MNQEGNERNLGSKPPPPVSGGGWRPCCCREGRLGRRMPDASHRSRGQRGLASAQVIRASASPSPGAGPSIWGLKEGDGGEGAPEGGSSAIEGTENRKREAPRGSCSESVSSLVAGTLLLASPGGAGEKLRLVQMP